MQINSPQIKFYRLLLCLIVVCYTHIHAQDTPVENYLDQVGGYAEIYNGRLEMIYNTLQYENLPYYENADYTEASVIYRSNYYPNQKMRLDLFKEQLILLAPGKLYGVILSPRNVKKVYMYNKTFVCLVPSKESGLKNGYYIQLFEGKKIQLFCKENYIIQPKDAIYRFERKIRHYLLYSDRYYPVKNTASFSKIFPQYKRQINKFSRDNKLNFKQNKDKSLTSLAGYCEVLLNLQNIQ
jgi:hypothetical protein